jgi:putative colanic acid biosysnthesis UDP-glucose lipid carrier transferase
MNNIIKNASPVPSYVVKLVDAALILLAAYLALHARRWLNLPAEMPVKFIASYDGLAVVGALLFTFFSGHVAGSWRGAQMPAMLAKLTGRWFVVIGLLLLWLFAFKATQEFSRVWFVAWALLATLLLWLGRLAIYWVLRSLRLRGVGLRQVAWVGAEAAVASLQARMASAGWSGYVVQQVVHDTHDMAQLEVLGSKPVDEIWVMLPLGDSQAIERTLHALRHSAASIRLVPDLLTLRLVNHGVTEIMGVPMYDVYASPMTGANHLLKWVEDKVLSLLILTLISPVMLAVALGVKLSSRGPVFYRQERVGLNNRSFKMLKFRSMPVDVEKEGVRWGDAATKATTRFGQFIRRTSLDELPQFLNVLWGDMSIVGPRPERPMFVEQFKEEIPDYMKKHLVKAGITGWAQVNGWRGDTDLKTRIEFDLFYIENWSVWLDLKIIFLTIFKGFLNKNAR